MFKAGDKVLCICVKWIVPPIIEFYFELPKYKKEYTIRNVSNSDKGPAVLLEEIVNPIADFASGRHELRFLAIHFIKAEDSFAEEVLENILKEAKTEEKVKEEDLCLV